jgi:hypothetical protein
MNSRQRFRETMSFGQPDRVPFFEEGIRDDVLKAWKKQGMPSGVSVEELFSIDRRADIQPELEPHPDLTKWPTERSDLAALERGLDANDPWRLPAGWTEFVHSPSRYENAITLRVHRGLFQTLGVAGWKRFEELIYLFKDDPELVQAALEIQAHFAAQLIQKVLSDVEVDAAIFSEPISDNNGPLISPQMFEQFAKISYRPVLDLLNRYGVETIIFRTYANAGILVPVALKWGFNCLWACEVYPGTMDYEVMRREYGRDLRLIGGIDVDVLRQDEETIRREVELKVPSLLEEGGFVPLADGRIRDYVPYENYVFYRSLLTKVVSGDF